MRLHAYAPGGISRYARRLARAMAPLVPAGALILVQHRKEKNALFLPDVRTWDAWTPPHHPFERWTLGAEIASLKLDIFHAADFIPPAWGARAMVATIHDLNFLYYPQYLTASARRYYNDQIHWAVSRADALIADSEATRTDLMAQLGVPAERVTVIHLAADTRFKKLSDAEVKPILEHYGLRAGYFLFVGTWEPRKNLPVLLDALAQLNARDESACLVIAGRPGWLYDDIYQHIQTLHLEQHVRFIEQPPPQHLVALYNGACGHIMPSIYEGFGLPVLEAMQCGTPVIASNRSSLPEVVSSAGLLVDPEDASALADAMQQLMHDEARRASLRKAGFARAQQFNWETTARQTLKVYQHLMND